MRIRFLPVAIFAAVLMLGVKVGNLFLGLDGTGVAPSLAQEAEKPSAGAGNAPAAAGAEAGKPAVSTPQAQGSAKVKGRGEKPAPVPAKKVKPGGLPSDPTLFTQAEIDLLQKLAARRAELERWSKDLNMREQLLKATERRVEKKVAELRSIQGKVKSMLMQYDKEQEGRLKSLVKIYENMKPKEAARIFMELDMPILLDVVERMKERKLAPIFAKMQPRKAKHVTKQIAARRKFRSGPAAARRPAPLPASTRPVLPSSRRGAQGQPRAVTPPQPQAAANPQPQPPAN